MLLHYNSCDKEHERADCPDRLKGPKCFKYRKYGHTASKCNNVDKEVCNVQQLLWTKCCKDLKIGDLKLSALIDTGNGLTFMRAGQHARIVAPKLGEKIIEFYGVESVKNYTLGEFFTNVLIDDESYDIMVHVIPKTLMRYPSLIATDFLNTVETSMKGGNMSIRKIESEDYDKFPKVLKLDMDVGKHDVHLSHITNIQYKQTIENLVRSYKLHKTVEIGVEVNLILQDDLPVCERPRRLSPQNKVEVNGQIKI